MKTILLAGAVGLVALTSTAKADPAYNWTGAYAGAHVGYSWGNLSSKDNEKDWCSAGDKACIAKYVGPFDWSADGVFGGGTLGYNYQINSFLVTGIEGDLGYLDLSGAGATASAHASQHQNLSATGGLYADITGRMGILVTPQTLVYGKGGFAFYNGSAAQTTTNPGYSSTPASNFTGWTVGGGVEHYITQNVSLKLEYAHFDFGTQEGNQTALVKDRDTPKGYEFKNWHSLDADTVKFGISYHF